MHEVRYTNDISKEIEVAVKKIQPSSTFILADTNTAMLCVPLLKADYPVIVIPCGDKYKNLNNTRYIWRRLQKLGADRESLLINVGGGMITDIGGFCASCYMRGIKFINVPTSLLGMTDASIGGKVAINEGGVKNNIGLISEPSLTIISTQFLPTLPEIEIVSAFGEICKYSLLTRNDKFYDVIWGATKSELRNIVLNNADLIIRECVSIKEKIVNEDLYDNDIRRILNLGHTYGHAVEAALLEVCTDCHHGIAVGWGLMFALFLSERLCSYSYVDIKKIFRRLKEIFGQPPTHIAVKEILSRMSYDKKNVDRGISFILISPTGLFDVVRLSLSETEKHLNAFNNLFN